MQTRHWKKYVVHFFSGSILEHGETEGHESPQTEENVSVLVCSHFIIMFMHKI